MKFDRKKYDREWRQRRRDAQRPAGATRCHIDGGALAFETNGVGKLVVRCVACERRRARKCMDCGAPVKGRAWRCEYHKAEAKARDFRAYGERHRDERNEREKRRYRKDPAYRQRRNEYKKRWREANPWKVFQYRTRQRRSKRGGFKTREAYLAYHKAYNAARAAEKREYMKRFNKNPQPVCKGCGVAVPYRGIGKPPSWCDAHRPHHYHPKKAA